MKVAYVDHSFHAKTLSTLFLLEILETKHQVTTFFDESWKRGESISIENLNKMDFDAIVFFQIIPSFKELKKLSCKNITWVPMYDSEYSRNIFEWLSLLICNIKIISFSETLSKKINKLGFKSLSVKFYPVPRFIKQNFESLRIFFWQRTKNIDWALLKKLIGNNNIEKITIRTELDYNHTQDIISKEDLQNFNIEIISGWLEKKDYLLMLEKCNLFVAPREREGIGMSFLDSMAFGIPVIAHNTATMNEYIDDGMTGYLYNIKHPKVLDFSKIKDIHNNIMADVTKGFEMWTKQLEYINDFVEESYLYNKKTKKMLIIVSVYHILNFYVHFLKKIIKIIIKK